MRETPDRTDSAGHPRPSDFPAAPADLRLVVVDMDGTLLDDAGALPADLPRVLDRLKSGAIAFAPASGRQYATLRDMFGGVRTESGATVDSFIAENGNVVVRDGEISAADGMDPEIVDDVIDAVRAARAEGRPMGLIVCHPDRAYVEIDQPGFNAEAAKYYHSRAVVEDLHEVNDGAIKLAIFDGRGSELEAAPLMERLVGGRLDVAVSGRCWVDMMVPGRDKGHAVRELQERLGVTPAQTAVFGDFLNDLQMMSAGEMSFAMANAHEDIKAASNYLAPSNTDSGVVVTLDRLLDEAAAARA
ncbi:HAD family hydrolase [Corynebacterium xerosis]|uniref:HAD family hydrolase n=1 Tax=Corynebacterium xerosis TaxID=1725 RepID=A0A2N6T1U8_9CORY|nr:HAD hydrolase family protein [Corynebacterium xerosis]PMC63297.1 HAD family hydrolase [Corynebacterium xerosis]